MALDLPFGKESKAITRVILHVDETLYHGGVSVDPQGKALRTPDGKLELSVSNYIVDKLRNALSRFVPEGSSVIHTRQLEERVHVHHPQGVVDAELRVNSDIAQRMRPVLEEAGIRMTIIHQKPKA